jgi:hypothetical protein
MAKTDYILKIVAGTAASAAADRSDFLKQHDPAFRASAHRRAAKIYNEAVNVECESHGKVTEAAYARLNETTKEATDECFAAGCALVTTKPTTMFGAVAMLRYLATVFDEAGLESNIMPETVDDEAWPCAVFRTLASALVQVQS